MAAALPKPARIRVAIKTAEAKQLKPAERPAQAVKPSSRKNRLRPSRRVTSGILITVLSEVFDQGGVDPENAGVFGAGVKPAMVFLGVETQ